MKDFVEEWRPVVGFEGLYEVSNTQKVRSVSRCTVGKKGNVRNFKGKILSNTLSNGYICYSLRNGKRGYKCYLHRLIAEAFIPNPDNKPCIDHINTIRTDNRIENLRWVTYKENYHNSITEEKIIRNAYKSKSCRDKIMITRDLKGLNKKIYTYNRDGFFVKEYNRSMDLAEELCVPSSHINNACLYGYAIKGVLCRYEKVERIIGHKFTNRRIAQYDLNGNFIREWESIKKACDFYSVKSIQNACSGKSKTSAGFKWKYID